ncbi:MAG: DUF1207 domain-containing protein [Elusimicrobia bacterium]|nr:DUF1207 domain-containing protein [Elusimicrobiota bacterium]
MLALPGLARANGIVPERPFPSAREYYPPLAADPTEPSYGARMIYPPGGARFGEITVGDYVGLTRWRLADRWNAQLNLGGGVTSRFNLSTERNSLEVTDFSFTLPLDIVLEPNNRVLRLAYWHTSSHLGDDFIGRVNPPLQKRAYDAFKGMLSYTPSDWLRVYGGGSYAFNQINLGGRGALQCGAELMSRRFWGINHLFLAQDLQSQERVAWNPSYNIRGGLKWFDARRIGAASLFVEYFTGHPYYLQFQQQRESHWGFGLRFEIGNPVS